MNPRDFARQAHLLHSSPLPVDALAEELARHLDSADLGAVSRALARHHGETFGVLPLSPENALERILQWTRIHVGNCARWQQQLRGLRKQPSGIRPATLDAVRELIAGWDALRDGFAISEEDHRRIVEPQREYLAFVELCLSNRKSALANGAHVSTAEQVLAATTPAPRKNPADVAAREAEHALMDVLTASGFKAKQAATHVAELLRASGLSKKATPNSIQSSWSKKKK